MDSTADDSLSRTRHEPLGLGFALSVARRAASRIPDFRRSARHASPPASGPLALPGIYSVRLTIPGVRTTTAAGGTQRVIFKPDVTEPLTIRMDPRVKTPPGGAFARFFAMQTSLADRMTRSSEAVSHARSFHEQLEKLSDRANESTKAANEALDKKLSALLEAAPEPVPQKPPAPAGAPVPPVPAESTLAQVAGNIAALYAEIDRADVAPTPAQDQALVTIERDFAVPQ